jgi:2-polyprenyl-3-methyl-5-hydroxy-6-metoxy-1,4-benzoquinol methylase
METGHSLRQDHWDAVYKSKAESEVSWFEASPEGSLKLIQASYPDTDAAILDVGAGRSRLVDTLLDHGYANLTVLDISNEAIKVVRDRLGSRVRTVRFIVADLRTWEPDLTVDVWHDRAALHFLVETADQHNYALAIQKAVRPGGLAILQTFGLQGPERCSGLPVQRHDDISLQALLGPTFRLEGSVERDHHTPWGSLQRFHSARFRRVG